MPLFFFLNVRYETSDETYETYISILPNLSFKLTDTFATYAMTLEVVHASQNNEPSLTVIEIVRVVA